MNTRGTASVVVLVLALGLTACGSASSPRSMAKGHSLPVVATTTQTADFARVVGGERVNVYDVVKPNVDPHDFEPSPGDLDAIGNAAVIVQNGVGLEAWFADVVRSAEPKGVTVDSSAGVPRRSLGGRPDPHIWHNPQNAIRMVTNIEEAFVKADPSHEAEYRKRAEDYVATLRSLDDEIQREVSTLTNKRLVTNHDALGYYVDRYRLEFVGSVVPSFDTSAELSARDVNDLVAKIKATGVKAIFSESSLPAKTAESIGREAGVKVVAGEDSLYVDSLGPRGSEAADYVGMMRHNTRVIVDNLR